MRPIFHWTPKRIRANLAIAYMAFACVPHLAYPVKLRKKRSLSPEAIRDAPPHLQCPILKHVGKAGRYAVPSAATFDVNF